MGADELNRNNEVMCRVAQGKRDVMNDAAIGDSVDCRDEFMTVFGGMLIRTLSRMKEIY